MFEKKAPFRRWVGIGGRDLRPQLAAIYLITLTTVVTLYYNYGPP